MAASRKKRAPGAITVDMAAAYKANSAEERFLEDSLLSMKKKIHTNRIRYRNEVDKVKKELEYLKSEQDKLKHTFTERELRSNGKYAPFLTKEKKPSPTDKFRKGAKAVMAVVKMKRSLKTTAEKMKDLEEEKKANKEKRKKLLEERMNQKVKDFIAKEMPGEQEVLL